MKTRDLITNTDFSNPFELIQDSIDYITKLTHGFDVLITSKLLLEGVTRFANNQITQHTDIQNLSLSLNLSKGKKIASAFTTTLQHDNLDIFVKNIISSLEHSPDIAFYQGFPDKKSGSSIDGSGYLWSPEERVEDIKNMIQYAEKKAPIVKIAGTASEDKIYRRIFSSNGLDIEDSMQMNYFKINAISGPPDSRGYGQDAQLWRHEKPDITKITEEVVTTSLKTVNFIDLPAPADYEVVLEPSAVSNIMDFVLFSINPVDFHEGNSFTSDRIGEQIFDKKLTLDNFPLDPQKAIIIGGFDNEGVPSHNETIIKSGILKHIPYNSFFASKYLNDKNLTTGGELYPFDDLPYPMPTSAVIKTGTKSIEDQISDVKDGLLVKTFWYNRFTIKKEGGLTGLTRNGLFHIKDGEIKEAVRNLRYTESFLNAFGANNIISIGNICKSDEDIISVPSMHLQKYHFSSVAHTFN